MLIIIIIIIITISLAIITHCFQMITFSHLHVLIFLIFENIFFFTFSLHLHSVLTVNMLLEILETGFPHLEKGNNNSSFSDFLEKLNEIVQLITLTQCLAYIVLLSLLQKAG